MREDYLEHIIRFYSPESRLLCSGHELFLAIVDEPGTGKIIEKWSTIMIKGDLLLEGEGRSAWVFTLPFSAPGADQPRQGVEILM